MGYFDLLCHCPSRLQRLTAKTSKYSAIRLRYMLAYAVTCESTYVYFYDGYMKVYFATRAEIQQQTGK